MKLADLWKSVLVLSAAVGGTGALASETQVDIKTNVGTVRLTLYPSKAPKTVENFLQYVADGHYNGTIMHRVIDGFMVQGGGFDAGFQQKQTRAPIPNEARGGVEAGLKNEAGSVAMARTANPDSATAQFFINVSDNGFLNSGDPRGDGHGYAVFAKVVSGMDVVNTIAKMPTGPGGPFPRDVPRERVIIESIVVVGPQ
jgi:peptidyl-prolyl cis-trans isomerase A (cyclophilin A)/peptidyl-prolyl cis-trans isomerase B (cyclophilin B)